MNIPWKKIGKYALTLGVGYLLERSRKKLPKALAGLLEGALCDHPDTPAEVKDALNRLLEARVGAQVRAHLPALQAELEAALTKGKSLAALSAEAALARERGKK